MFLNLTPYITWLGIMLTSKPNDLQNRLNIIHSGPPPAVAPPPPIVTTPPGTTDPISDYFVCAGRRNGRYPHSRDCSKYFICTGENEIARPSSCPQGLHFSPIVLLCTLPRDAGCVVPETTPMLPPSGSGSTTSPVTTPPGSTWLAQIQLARYHKAVEEDRLVIYYDHDVPTPQSLLWPIPFIRNMWDSIFNMYGSFGSTNRLYALLRGRPLPQTLNYASYLDSSKGYLNGIEVGSSNWTTESPTNVDLITRNLAHIVSRNARGIRYPGPEPGWADIFVHDLYQRTGRISDRDRWDAQTISDAEGNIASIPMFGQWYLPIYRTYGGGSVLNRFLVLREQYFPKNPSNNSTFARTMNRGEFIHFWSGSSGANLTSLAAEVFGSSPAIGEQYRQARVDFSALNY